ncbi:MAG: HAD family hydrolase, partial [Candidatus Dormibacteria bacterium]
WRSPRWRRRGLSPKKRREPVEGVLFDYGNTLVTFRRPDAALERAYGDIEQLLRRSDLAPPDAAVLLREVHDRVELEFAEHQRSGTLEEIDLVAAARRAYADLGLRLDDEALDELLRMEQEAWWEGVSVDPDAAPTLELLRSKGLRVGLCSNAPYRVRSMHEQLAHFGLDRHLDSVTFSGAVGWRKPSPRIFDVAAEALGVSRGRTVMIGDSLHDDVDGARAAGMRAVLLVRDGSRAPAEGVAVVNEGDTVSVVSALSEIAAVVLR